MQVYHQVLGEYREHLNALNVYPVPDADTGTNLHSTIGAVASALAKGTESSQSMSEVCQAIRQGAILGARGASGVITSQLLGALVRSFPDNDPIDGVAFAAALAAAGDAAYQAVLRPVEGTILTVVRESAEAANLSVQSHDGSLIEVLEAARHAAGVALEKTPDQLPALKAAGVVDAGGWGFVLALDSFLHAVDGRPLPEAPGQTGRPPAAPMPEDMPRYEVVLRLQAPEGEMDEFRAVWEKLGNDSTVLVEGDRDWVCHIHTNHLEAALEAARAAGTVDDAHVTDLVEQIAQLRSAHAEGVAVVAVTAAPGIQDWFLERGTTAVVAGGASRNPSTAELLQAVETTGSTTVILLPNDENVIPAATQLGTLTERRVVVVPTRSVPEGMAALRRFDPAKADGDVEEMRQAMMGVASGGVTRAVRDAGSPAGPITAGTWISRATDGSVRTAPNPREAIMGLVQQLVGDQIPSRIAIVTGVDADPNDVEEVIRQVEAKWPGTETSLIVGDQEHYPYLIGVESAHVGIQGQVR